MSDSEASCACLTVKYLTRPSDDPRGGGVVGWWCCTSCGNKFIPWGAHRFLRDEAVRDALNGVCVKKPEAEPMSGELEEKVLEEALKHDVKAKELGDPGTRHTGPRPSHPEFKPAQVHTFVDPSTSPTEGDLHAPSVATIKAEVNERLGDMKVPMRDAIDAMVKMPFSGDLPDGMKTVLWVPIQNYGETLFQCTVEGFGLRATATSRLKQRALAYALEDIARQMIEAST